MRRRVLGFALRAADDVGYLFLTSRLTQKECFEKKLFGHSRKQLRIVEKITKGSPVFLFHTDTKSLIGPFVAASDGKYNIDPDAWTTIYRYGFPSQVRVEWKELHEIREAPTILPFLNIYYHYQLSQEETKAISSALRNAPPFNPSDEDKGEFRIESEAERKFAELLDDKEIAYIRFSQMPGDFSRVLKDLKAKRPDFLVFTEKPYFIEVKPWLFQMSKQDITIKFGEIEKLKQLELATSVDVTIAFPIDPHGLEWRAVDPAWAWAKGERRVVENEEVVTIPIKEVEKHRLPFLQR